MATITNVILIDDTDGTEAAESLRFALDGTDYEIDLNAGNAGSLRSALARYIAHARKPSRPAPAQKHAPVRDTAAIRAWAAERSITINERGRIPGSVETRYNAAMADAANRPATAPQSPAEPRRARPGR